MRKIFLCVAALATLPGCTVDDGTTPGGDGQPRVTIYQYAPTGDIAPDDKDQSVRLRISSNSKVQEFYYLAEPVVEKEAFVNANGMEAYMERVKSQGTKHSATAEDFDLLKDGMPGTYAISVVAMGGGKQTIAESIYKGVTWKDVTTGTYHFNILYGRKVTPESVHTTLQVNVEDATQYRFKDLFGEKYSLKLQTLPTYTGKDGAGDYIFFRVPVQETSYTYPVSGAQQKIGVRDVGYWQGNDAFVLTGGYESGLYTSGTVNSAFIYAQYFITAGSLGYNYDEFVAD